MHRPRETHDTPPRLLPVVPVGLGALTALHDLPFHTCENQLLWLFRMAYPVAMQASGELHETLSKPPSEATAGVFLTAQILPFHPSARGRLRCGISHWPTAMHA